MAFRHQMFSECLVEMLHEGRNDRAIITTLRTRWPEIELTQAALSHLRWCAERGFLIRTRLDEAGSFDNTHTEGCSQMQGFISQRFAESIKGR